MFIFFYAKKFLSCPLWGSCPSTLGKLQLVNFGDEYINRNRCFTYPHSSTKEIFFRVSLGGSCPPILGKLYLVNSEDRYINTNRCFSCLHYSTRYVPKCLSCPLKGGAPRTLKNTTKEDKLAHVCNTNETRCVNVTRSGRPPIISGKGASMETRAIIGVILRRAPQNVFKPFYRYAERVSLFERDISCITGRP